jgi:sensor histidine kinase YesM
MKKAILLTIILIGILYFPSVTRFNIQKLEDAPAGTYAVTKKFLEKDSLVMRWEYVKTRIFGEGRSVSPRFEGPILIALEGETLEQREIIREIIQEIDSMLPTRRVAFYKDHTGHDHEEFIRDGFGKTLEKIRVSSAYDSLYNLYRGSVQISFNRDPFKSGRLEFPFSPDYHTSVLRDSSKIIRNQFTTFTPSSEIKGALIYFQLSKELYIERQKQYLRYELLRSLCHIVPYPIASNSRLAVVSGAKTEYNPQGLYYDEQYKPESDFIITEYDRFLLEKLYSENFRPEFNEYLNTYYSQRYRLNFLYRNTVKITVSILLVLLGVVIFILSILLLHKRTFRFSFFNYLIPIFIVCATFTGIEQLYRFLTHDHVISGLASFLGVSTGLCITVIIQTLYLWIFETFVFRNISSFVLSLSIKISLTFSSYYIAYFFMRPYDESYATSILIFGLVITLTRGFYIYLNHYTESIIRQKDLQLSQMRELQLTTELNSLHARINPHFLYNALNSIASLARLDEIKTEKMALSLSDLFRYSVNRKGEKMTTIKEEIEMVENYLQIEKIRFEDRLEFSLHVDESLYYHKIPRFILQPLVENAIKHGISKLEEKGYILLVIIKKNNSLHLSVSDNGPDFPDGLLSGHGLQSVFDLLHLSYGENASLNWENLPKKKITITINSNS